MSGKEVKIISEWKDMKSLRQPEEKPADDRSDERPFHQVVIISSNGNGRKTSVTRHVSATRLNTLR